MFSSRNGLGIGYKSVPMGGWPGAVAVMWPGCQAHQLLLLRHVGDRALCADLIRRCLICDKDIDCDATPPSKDPTPGLCHFFGIVSLLSFTFHRYCEGFCIPTGHTLCYLRIQRRGKRRKRDAPMPQPQNITQENRDQLLDELRSPDRPEPDKRGLNKVLVQFQVKESQILQDLS